MGYAFISYSTKNQAAADAMRTLFGKHKIDTWMAPYDIPAGSKYAAVITKAIRNCSCFVLLLSNDSQASEAVDSEVELATLEFKKSVITVELEKVILNDAFTFYIHNKQIIAVHQIDEESYEIKQVINAVKAYTKDEDEDTAVVVNKESILADDAISSVVKEDTLITDLIESDQGDGLTDDLILSDECDIQDGADTKDLVNSTENDEMDYSSFADQSMLVIEEGYSAEQVDAEDDVDSDEEVFKEISVIEQLESSPVIAVSAEKNKGHLVNSYNRVCDIDSKDCEQPVKIEMPDGSERYFDYCDEFEVSNQKRYVVVKQKNEKGEYLFFVFRTRNGKKTLVTEGPDQIKVYRWFRDRYKDKYIFTDNNAIFKKDKKKHFAQDTALKLFGSAEKIPEILTLPEKYQQISSNAFSKLDPRNKEIRQIIISDKVEIIDDNAFSGLIVTEAIHIPSSVRRIGENAFTIKEGACVFCTGKSRAHVYFAKNTNVKVVIDVPYKRTVEKDAEKIIQELCSSKIVTRIKTNTIPTKRDAFGLVADKPVVDEIVLPEGVCVIEEQALNNVRVQKRIIVPASVKRIGERAFELTEDAYVECQENSYAYYYCKENGIRNSVDISNYYRTQNLCAHCGGGFTGLFRKKCAICGIEKDY